MKTEEIKIQGLVATKAVPASKDLEIEIAIKGQKTNLIASDAVVKSLLKNRNLQGKTYGACVMGRVKNGRLISAWLHRTRKTVIIDSPLYGDKTEFATLNEAESTLRHMGDDAAGNSDSEWDRTRLHARGDEIVNENADVVGSI